jgi:hypothetical protein
MQIEPKALPLVVLIKADDFKNASRPKVSSLESSFFPSNNALGF